MLLWLWYRLAATGLIQPLAWELPDAVGAGLVGRRGGLGDRGGNFYPQGNACTGKHILSSKGIEMGFQRKNKGAVKKRGHGIPVVAQRKQMRVRSLASLNGLTIRHCCGCGVGQQL